MLIGGGRRWLGGARAGMEEGGGDGPPLISRDGCSGGGPWPVEGRWCQSKDRGDAYLGGGGCTGGALGARVGGSGGGATCWAWIGGGAIGMATGGGGAGA